MLGAATGRRLNMASNWYKKAFNGLLETYVLLNVSGETIVRQLKKTPACTQSKLIQELRNLESRRLEILDQIDMLAKPT